jgi:phosphoribosylaminoimidazole-succinocarboxamide synthase
MSDGTVLRTELEGLTLKARGKVRDIYELPDALLIVTTDRISAFDVVLPNGIPDKGKVLTAVSCFWFDQLIDVVPHHLITADVDEMPEAVRAHADVLRGRTMLVKKCDPLPVECVARGYLAGSGLKEYRVSKTVCGIGLPDGLVESSKLPEPIFTPATKAEVGDHDENIDFARMCSIVGDEMGATLRDLTLTLYGRGADFAREKGVILADTKFEFGMHDGELTLIDEALTPDSSRYWEASAWEPGRPQPSFDKQPVRDWLDGLDWDKKPPAPPMPAEAVEATRSRYLEIHRRLTGKELP